MIDWKVSTELYQDVGPDLYAEIISVMKQEAAQRLSSLGATDRNLAYDLYMLKGLALNMGFTNMSALCETGEIAENSNDKLPRYIDKIRACFDASNQAFSAKENRAHAG